MKDYGEMFTPEGVQFKWNSSSLQLADACPRKYQYQMLQKWKFPGESVHLKFGGLFADALDLFYKSRETLPREEAVQAAVDFAIDASYGWESEDNLKNRPNLIRTLVWYFEEYKDDIPVTRINDAPAVELKFELDADNGVVFAGTIDRLVDYSDTIFVMDQKTTGGTISPYYFQRYDPDIQMSMYTFAGKASYTEEVKGVLIDAVQVAVGFSRFARQPVYRTASQLSEWYDEMMELIELTQHYTRENHFPKRTASCFNYGGCPFREVCSRSPEVRKNFLAAKFVQGDDDAKQSQS